MKRILLFFAAYGFVACGQLELPEGVEQIEQVTEYTRKFTFTVKGDFHNENFSSPDTYCVIAGCAPTDSWGGANRRAAQNQYMVADGVEMTDLWVVDVKDGQIIQSVHQSPSDEDWGSPQMSLTLGTHHVLFLASRGQGATYADGVVTWNKPLDTFYKDYEVTVVRTSNGNRAVTLDRVATKLQVVVDDAVAAGTTSITLSPTTWYTGWNMLTASPVAGDYEGVFPISSSQWGGKGLELNMWSLSGTAEWVTDVAITSKAGNNTNAEATISDAPLKANRVSRLSGVLYSATSSTGVSLNTDWTAQYTGVY